MECLNVLFDEKKFNLFYEKLLKDSKNQIDELEKQEKTKELRNYLNSVKKSYKRMKSIKYKNKLRKDERERYLKEFCNPGCKNTMFESGEPNYLSEKYLKELGQNSLINIHKQQRKAIFGKDKNVLVDNFYKNINSKTVKKLKKRGALSGCMKDAKIPY
jgi:hypothetical protein